jgi:hypothetical protein
MEHSFQLSILPKRFGVEIPFLSVNLEPRPGHLDIDLMIGAVPGVIDIVAENVVAAGQVLRLIPGTLTIIPNRLRNLWTTIINRVAQIEFCLNYS